LRPLRTEVEIAAALDNLEEDEDDLQSTNGSMEDLSRGRGEETQTGI
jgi:hypothetical protein